MKKKYNSELPEWEDNLDIEMTPSQESFDAKKQKEDLYERRIYESEVRIQELKNKLQDLEEEEDSFDRIEEQEQRAEYEKRKDKAAEISKGVTVCLFTFVLTFCSLIGAILPLRPSESVMEKRKLAEFPVFSVDGVLDGSYFSDISTWYADTYPMRDELLQQYGRLKELYGIRTIQIITGNTIIDEIPDYENRDPKEESIQASESGEKNTKPDQTGSENHSTNSTEEESEAKTEDTSAIESEPQTTLAPIVGQTQNGVFVSGDTGYGIFYYNNTAADLYINTLNRTAENLSGISNIYSIIVPISSTIYLGIDEIRKFVPDASDESRAIGYYNSALDARIKQISAIDILTEHKEEYIYFRTDHHWTALGTYYVYEEWAKTKGVEPNPLESYEQVAFPGFLGSYHDTSRATSMESNPDTVIAYKPLTCNRMHFVERSGTELDWNIINDVSGYRSSQKYSCFSAGDNPYSIINNPNVTNGESCLVIKDSYGNTMIPFLTDHYQTIHWIDFRSFHGNITEFVKENNITDVIFIGGAEPNSSIELMERLSALLP